MTQPTSFVLPVDKPAGPTSHDVVAHARRALQERRIGHTGTLDPFASGLLLLCVGAATRIAEYLTDLPKTYRAAARFDGRTATDDATSAVVEPAMRAQPLQPEEVQQAFARQVGEILQMPPQFSAKKIAGERAYDIARRGDVATLTPVQVRIHEITIERISLPEVDFTVTCSSGTYIRALARDVGTLLGTGGYLTALRRTHVGRHSVDRAVPLDSITDTARVHAAALSPAEALAHLPAVTLSDDEKRAVLFGQAVEHAEQPAGPVRMLHGGALIAIGAFESGQLRPRKVFADA